ncbi:hypothetical protein GN956_G3284 [Arapaima gigas]
MMAASVAKFMLLAVTVLAVQTAEGWLITKCELKNNLEAAFQGNQPTGNLSFENNSLGNHSFGNQSLGNQTIMDLVAKIVCKVQQTSGFNTSLVTPLAPNNPHINNMCNMTKPQPNADRPLEPPKSLPPKRREHNAWRRKSGEERKKPIRHSESKEDSEEQPDHMRPPSPMVHLYGIFQLSDCAACSNGITPSSNICNMPCTALTDDNISDDIACFKMTNDCNLNHPAMFPQQCATVEYSTYFSDCP